jgi:hypothetical protein
MNKHKQIVRHYSLYTRETDIETPFDISLCIHFQSRNKRKIIEYNKRMQRKYKKSSRIWDTRQKHVHGKNTSTMSAFGECLPPPSSLSLALTSTT